MAEESGYKATATSYPGVAFIAGKHPSTGKPDKIFYISYYRGGKRKHEKAGRASIDGMTAAKANQIGTNAWAQTTPLALLRRNVIILAKFAKGTGMPVVLTSSQETNVNVQGLR